MAASSISPPSSSTDLFPLIIKTFSDLSLSCASTRALHPHHPHLHQASTSPAACSPSPAPSYTAVPLLLLPSSHTLGLKRGPPPAAMHRSAMLPRAALPHAPRQHPVLLHCSSLAAMVLRPTLGHLMSAACSPSGNPTLTNQAVCRALRHLPPHQQTSLALSIKAATSISHPQPWPRLIPSLAGRSRAHACRSHRHGLAHPTRPQTSRRNSLRAHARSTPVHDERNGFLGVKTRLKSIKM